MRFKELTEKSTKVTVFWDVALCSLVEVYGRFKGAYSHHLQGDLIKFYPGLILCKR
jgi:hypothetical protein